MNSKTILTSYAILMAIAGIGVLFLGDEVTALLNIQSSPLINALLAALFFGFATTNWHSKNLTIGGVYGRPLVLGNLSHTLIGSISLIKIANDTSTLTTIILTIIYSIFALAFTWLMYTHPKTNNN